MSRTATSVPRARALRIAGAIGAGAMVLGLVTVGAAVADSGSSDRVSVSVKHHKMIRKAGSLDGPGTKKSREAAPKFADGPGGKRSREAAPKFVDGPGGKRSREAAPKFADGPGAKKSREAAPKFMDGPGAKKSREAAPTSSD